jgi:antitoxin HicB
VAAQEEDEVKTRAPRVQDYPIMLRALLPDEGGGFLAEMPDLPGCVGDGESEEVAIKDVRDAARQWIAEAKRLGREIPGPSSSEAYSGKWVQRVPKTLHRRLASQAKREGVSLNTLAATLLAEGVAQRRG